MLYNIAPLKHTHFLLTTFKNISEVSLFGFFSLFFSHNFGLIKIMLIWIANVEKIDSLGNYWLHATGLFLYPLKT